MIDGNPSSSFSRAWREGTEQLIERLLKLVLSLMLGIFDRMRSYSGPDGAVRRSIEDLEGKAPLGYVSGRRTAAGFPDAVPRHRGSASRGEGRVQRSAHIYIRSNRGVIRHQNICRIDWRFGHADVVEHIADAIPDIGVQLRIKQRRSLDPGVGLEFREVCRLVVVDLDFLCLDLRNE